MSRTAGNFPSKLRRAGAGSLLYLPGETLYGAVAQKALKLGWTLIPQERGERRQPSKIDGRTLKWGNYVDMAPTSEEVHHWANQAPGANAAILLGKPSGLILCYDIDVMDVQLSQAIQQLAGEILPYTEFCRVGQAPKAALFYRVATEAELPASKAYRFADSGNMLEVLANGRLITAVGYHHKTDRYFQWDGPQPSTNPTTDVPLITAAQHEAFIEAVQKLRPFSRPSSAKAGDGVVFEGDGSLEVSTDGWTIPRVYCPSAGIEAGKVVDGRKQWLSALVWDLVRYNPERAAESVASLIEVAMGVAMDRIDMSKPLDVRGIIADKARRDVETLRRGEIRSFPEVKEQDGKRITQGRGVLPGIADAQLWHLPTSDKRKALEIAARTTPDGEKAAARAIITDRSAIAADIAGRVETALGSFFDVVYAQEHTPAVHVLKVPTGGGKTTSAIRYIADDPRTFEPLVGEDGEPCGPILFLLPSYANIDELRSRAAAASLDPDLDDEELMRQAALLGLVSIDDADAEIKRLRDQAEGTGLHTMVYKGKIAAGCKFAEKVQRLMDAGISTSGLCRAKVKDDRGNVEEKFCEFYGSCKAILQRQEIAQSHVVFLPHAFLNLSIPDELKNCRGVIADERIFTLATHVGLMHMSTLELPRNPPPLGKKERELVTAGISGREEKSAKIEAVRMAYLQDRHDATEIAIAAMRDGQCPAAVLADHKQGKFTGMDLVAAAARVCGAGSSSNVLVYPGMSDREFQDLVGVPTGTEIRLEYRFWKIIGERIAMLTDGTARQAREMRIQRRQHTEGEAEVEYVRLSWRSELNWPSAPLLLLDASADADIVDKAFPGKAVTLHDIDAPLNLKTVLIADRSRSTRSLTPVSDITNADAIAQARNVERVRAVETYLAAVHSNGRIIVGMAKKVREMLRHEYVAPANVDDLHFGAERGLNFAEEHVAALSIGRMELPVWTLDAYAAALGYDDMEPLVLMDSRGDGMLSDTEPLKPLLLPQVLPMRDGSDVTIQVPMAPEGSWQRTVQQQFREESIRQFAGRLRPVYRQETPVLYIMSQCVPSGIVIDDIVATDDLIPSYVPLLDAARGNGGIIDPQRLHRGRADLGTLQQFVDWTTALPAQLKDGFHFLRVARKTVAVPAHYEDPVAVAALWYPDCEVTETIRSAACIRVAPADGRPVDKIEQALGSAADRAEAELSALARAVEWLEQRHAEDTTRSHYVPGRGKYQVGVDRDGRSVLLGLTALAMLTRPMAPAEVVEDVPLGKPHS